MINKKVLVLKHKDYYGHIPYKKGTVVLETNKYVLVKYDGLFSGSEWVLKEEYRQLPYIELLGNGKEV